MNFKRFAAAVSAVAVVCLFLLSGCGAAGDKSGGDLLAQIQEKGEINIGLEGTWAPWGYHDESGELVGYDVEVGQKIAEKLGVKAVFSEGPWDSLLAGVESGRYDTMINGVDVDESRSKTYDFSTPYAYNRTVVIVRADDDSIQSMEDLSGKSTANTLSSTYANVAESYGASVTPVDDFIQTIELLMDGRIDATLNAEVSFQDYIAIHPDAPVKIACVDPAATQVAIPFQKGENTRTLREAVDQALAELAQDGTLAELSVKYFGIDISSAG